MATTNLQGNVEIEEKSPGATLFNVAVSAPVVPAQQESCIALNAGYEHLDVIIAFVPDPYRTRLRLQFDQTIEALTWAAQQDGELNFRDSWLPWKVREDEYTILNDRSTYDEQQEALRRKPGVLVFSGSGRGLAILLVGESPTKAFDQDQFVTALDHWKDFWQSGSIVGAGGYCFMGPRT